MQRYAIDVLKGPTSVAAVSLAGTDVGSKKNDYKILLEASGELLRLKNEYLARNKLDDGRPYFTFHERLDRGVKECGSRRFSIINDTYILQCAADRLRRTSERYGISRGNLRIFLVTDTPALPQSIQKGHA